ncbi:Uncharacterized protein APZ42_000767 [Daphnia magna]|uniref:Uncharacterized protein n=1 Tax=Daphnia magna TaxID=35525 RepID=A0A164JE85_9CRUS|nr:Uncharacterized protein APZ42_000767 [Daphnia magna]
MLHFRRKLLPHHRWSLPVVPKIKNYHFYKLKCISGLPSFLWPRFPLTRNKPEGGYAPTVISSKGCECAARKGDVGVLKFYDIIGGRRGYPQIRING